LRALAIREQHLGPEHPFVARTLECYAHLLRQIERSNEAIALEKRIRAIRTRQEQAGQHV